MKSLLLITICLMSLISMTAWSEEQSVSTITVNDTNTTSSTQTNILSGGTANRINDLMTDSIYYSVPSEGNSFTEIGGYNKNESLFGTDTDSQVFYFEHSTGITNQIALDFGLSYLQADENSPNSSGIDNAILGVRSNFYAMDLNWVYGASLAYLPNEDKGSNTELGVAGKIGFETNAGVARWGLETEMTTKDSILFDNQILLNGFFEFPFFKQVAVGAAAGLDFANFTSTEKNSYGKIFAQYDIDSSSSAQILLKKSAEESGAGNYSDTQAGLAINKIF